MATPDPIRTYRDPILSLASFLRDRSQELCIVLPRKIGSDATLQGLLHDHELPSGR
jgi:hypothetical protein